MTNRSTTIIETDCLNNDVWCRVGSINCRKCKYYILKIPFIRIILCKYKERKVKCYRARKIYVCEICGKKIVKDEKYYRLFRCAFKGEKPYGIVECCNCISKVVKDVQERLLNETRKN
jgi:ribosomal protein L34E